MLPKSLTPPSHHKAKDRADFGNLLSELLQGLHPAENKKPTTSTNTVLVYLPDFLRTFQIFPSIYLPGVESLLGKVHRWRRQQYTQLQSYICFLESHTVNAKCFKYGCGPVYYSTETHHYSFHIHLSLKTSVPDLFSEKIKTRLFNQEHCKLNLVPEMHITIPSTTSLS